MLEYYNQGLIPIRMSFGLQCVSEENKNVLFNVKMFLRLPNSKTNPKPIFIDNLHILEKLIDNANRMPELLYS